MVGLAVLGPPYALPEGKKTSRRLKPGLQQSIPDEQRRTKVTPLAGPETIVQMNVR